MTHPPHQLTEVTDSTAPVPPRVDDTGQFAVLRPDVDAPPAWSAPAPVTHQPARRRANWRAVVPKTLTGRMVAFVVALVVLVVVAIGASTYWSLRSFLYHKLDQQLSTVAAQAEFNPANAPIVGGAQGLWVGFYSSSGQPSAHVNERYSLHDLALSSDDARLLLGHANAAQTVTTSDGVEVRAVALSSAVSVNGVASVEIVGLSTYDVRETLSRLIVLELAIGAGAVALAAGVTAWGVRVGLRPLHRVTRTAQEVTAELGPHGQGLERRVPDADPGTEVGQVASSVNTLLGAVQTEFAARLRSEDRMRQFLADASHELRTPLTSIRGYAELSRLQGRYSDDPDDPMRRIEVEGTRMSRLVEDLLVLARGDDASNEIRREPVDVDAVLSDALSSVRSAHPERTFELEPSGGATVIGDRDQLIRLLVNLLNNAAVHTAPEGVIRLQALNGTIPVGPAVALNVIDQGPGLPEAEAKHVFERFWRADKARSRARGGSGLGMSIVAQIVAAHGGSIDFRSRVEDGTTVMVVLPAAPPQVVTRGPGPEAAGQN